MHGSNPDELWKPAVQRTRPLGVAVAVLEALEVCVADNDDVVVAALEVLAEVVVDAVGVNGTQPLAFTPGFVGVPPKFAAHVLQAPGIVAPLCAVVVPAGHGTQLEELTEYCPMPQIEQPVASTPGFDGVPMYPAAQAEHMIAEVRPVAAVVVPSGQGVHAADPGSIVYVPTGQRRQAAM
jgi:hypothetical protein